MLNFKNTTPIILSPISSSKRHTNSWNSSCNAKFESFHPVVPSLPRKFARFFRKYVSRKHHFLLNQALFFESINIKPSFLNALFKNLASCIYAAIKDLIEKFNLSKLLIKSFSSVLSSVLKGGSKFL